MLTRQVGLGFYEATTDVITFIYKILERTLYSMCAFHLHGKNDQTVQIVQMESKTFSVSECSHRKIWIKTK